MELDDVNAELVKVEALIETWEGVLRRLTERRGELWRAGEVEKDGTWTARIRQFEMEMHDATRR